MAAYMIVLTKLHDRARFLAEYAAPTAALIGEFGGEYLVRSPAPTLLENAEMFEGFSAVISKWPDRAAIERFWSSDAYEKLKALRQPLAEAHILVVEDPA